MARPRDRRGDTQPVRSAPGQPFGQRQELEQAQEAVPLPDRRAQLAQAIQQAQAMPFQPVGLGAPSQRPDEPLTAGLPSGPGAMQMDAPPPQPSIELGQDIGVVVLQELMRRFPSADIAALLEGR